ncbi:MAG: hypothetical protein CMJ23_10320 [Phycisphaerae bacterium]|nr:hypothetical protein [Phycisphaerae bacterium]
MTHVPQGPIRSRRFLRLGGSDSKATSSSKSALLRFGRHQAGPVLDSRKSEINVTADLSNPMDENAVTKRCVILVAPNEHPPQPLVNLLGDQPDTAHEIIRAEHPLTALARLASLERGRRMRSEWSPGEPEQTILVVVNRESWRDLSPLFESIRQLMPAVGIWVCTERIAIEIYAGESNDENAAPEDGSPGAISETTAPPVNQPPEAPDADHDPASLTEDELQDLLDLYDDFEEDDQAPSDGGSSKP